MAVLRKEERELKIALSALDGSKPKANGTRGAVRTTYKEMVVAVLRRHGGGHVDSLVGFVKDAYGIEMPKSSISPLLSKLKAEGLVDLDQTKKIWRLASGSQPPDGNGVSADISETKVGSATDASDLL